MKEILQKHWKENFIILCLIVIVGSSTVSASFTNAQILNALIHYDMNALIKGLLKLIFIYSFVLFFSYLQFIQQSKTIQRMSASLRNSIMKKVIWQDYTNYHKNKIGTYASWLTNDINQIEQMGFQPFYELLEGLINSLLAFAALFLVHWSLVLLTVIEVVLLLQIPKLFSKKIEKTTEQTTLQNEKFLSEVNDSLAAYDTVTSFNKRPYLLKKINQATKILSVIKMKQEKVMANISITGGTGNIVSQILVYLLTAYLAFNQVIAIGTLSITGSFASEIFNTVGNISQYLAAINSTKTLFEKFEKIKENETKSTLDLQNLVSGFQLKNLNFGYNNTNLLLNDLNYNFTLGGKYAIVGKSGSGKTTLLNLLSGKQKNYSGKILFNNQEMKALSEQQLLSEILYIDQEPHIFANTIRENLALDDFFSDEELWEALKQVDLFEMVKQSPKGLDTQAGELGKFLSSGQGQRLSLARGLLRNKKIILLDEVTSHLDNTTAQIIEEKLLAENNLTVIMITHQLSKDIEQQLDGVLSLT